METTGRMADESAPNPVQEAKARMAVQIREASQQGTELTTLESLAHHLVGLGGEEAESVFGGLLYDDEYQDIRALTISSGAVYFYSEEHLAPPTAEGQVLLEEAKLRVAATVRKDSSELAKLTAGASLSPLLTEIGFEDAEAVLDSLAEDERYGDVQTITTAGGDRYLYSRQHMTESYATLLARVAADDPLAALAETVRDESRIYPRPTDVRLFLEPPFSLKREEVTVLVERLLQTEEYSDIKQIEASTGAVYLYSERHLKKGSAKSMVQWEEVESYMNP
jgi:hypothetical protein